MPTRLSRPSRASRRATWREGLGVKEGRRQGGQAGGDGRREGLPWSELSDEHRLRAAGLRDRLGASLRCAICMGLARTCEARGRVSATGRANYSPEPERSCTNLSRRGRSLGLRLEGKAETVHGQGLEFLHLARRRHAGPRREKPHRTARGNCSSAHWIEVSAKAARTRTFPSGVWAINKI